MNSGTNKLALSTPTLLTALSVVLCGLAPAQDLLLGSPNTQIHLGSSVSGDFQVVGACGGIVSSMTTIGETTYIGDQSGILYFYHPATGVNYSFNVGNDATGLASHQGDLLVAGSNGSVERYDLATSALIGTMQAGITIDALLVVGDEVFVGGPQGVIEKAALTGGGTFAFWGNCGGPIDSLAHDQDALILGTTTGVIYRYDLSNGAALGAFGVTVDAVAMDMHFGDLLVADSSGVIQRLNAVTGFLHTSMSSGNTLSALSMTETNAPGSTYCYGVLCPCSNNDPLAGCQNSTGQGALLRGVGTSSLSADDLTLFATSVPSSQYGLMYMGNGFGWAHIGDGELCMGGGSGLFRFPVVQVGTGGFVAQGDLVAYSNAQFGALGQLTVGESWTFQLWYRDPFGPCGTRFNTTNGYSVTFTP